MALTGVRIEEVGDLYDFALGYLDPVSGNTNMVGYVAPPSVGYGESTNLQDEGHIVQVASPNTTDRYSRFPKVSQGDWSGGERQLIYTTPNQYYSSQQLETSRPGHLTILGKYSAVALGTSPSPIAPNPRAISSDAIQYWFICTPNNGTILGYVNEATLAVTLSANNPALGGLQEILRGPDGMYVANNPAAGLGIYQISVNGAFAVTRVNADTIGTVVAGSYSRCDMAAFNDTLYYNSEISGGPPPVTQILSSTYPFPGGAGNGTTVYTMPQMGWQILAITDSANGVAFATAAQQQLYSYIWTFDGVNATFVGRIYGTVIDMRSANGVTYILAAARNGISGGIGLPVIYQLSGSTLSVLDDYRQADPAFQPTTQSGRGCLDEDGTYLYLFWSGLRVKRYRLKDGAIYDVGHPTAQQSNSAVHSGAAGPGGGIAEGDPTNVPYSLYVMQPGVAPNQNGILTTSFYDFGTPNDHKSFKSVEFTMNSAIDVNAILVSYRVDNLSNTLTPVTVTVSPSGNTLIAYFPPNTLGCRVQLQITLVAASNPDIASLSVLATLARIFTLGAACRRDQQARNGAKDPQGLAASDRLANVLNCYNIAAGKCVLYIPDPTAAKGYAQINALLQDYKRVTAPGVAPGMREDATGQRDMESDYQLTLAEQL